ncbi:GntR family transcriptional regulator [Actinoallomurus iriomotensis]|uniref:GntR family transcriptional regulator n=1 Tax=Actinoallomurus iriomotensis TaxID=478107 RepID=A0A9W6VQY4_9ACTN|nr:GntR family transcriptional regulator [Actinoallomurus iriomotensis]GLY75096.1 GntR family transcriptional regulator [Actinoallomurus iriomotensis]
MDIDKASPSPIEFRLDPGSGVPTYLQLVQQVEQALRLGYLREGDQLPRVKDVVAGLAINPNTVLKAYRELEHRGLVAGRRGLGTFVSVAPDVVGLREQAALRKSMLAWMRTASEAGVDEEGMAALFTAALHELRQGHDGRTDDEDGGRAEVSA